MQSPPITHRSFAVALLAPSLAAGSDGEPDDTKAITRDAPLMCQPTGNEVEA